ncbi:hypothetical protein SAMN05443665_102725 [Actinomadura meyerae]|uniref:Uncharacterized protein n=1 Tax=Actinomadura meyerae TaxID=240840 RepID=A0A239MCX2_9ACTN|nr:hypothetical protein [Actinomadura meyerae]SNT39828.1 hypothetical protein SAMN05443665_102725 [Actinomadura meyerae]
MDEALFLILILAVLAWAHFLRSTMVSWIWGPLVRSTDGDVALAAVRSAVLYLAGAAAVGLALLAVHSVLDGLFARAAAFMLSLLYAPVAYMPIFTRGDPYGAIRRLLMRAGATEKQARASAWATGPLTFIGLAVVGGGLLSAFVA